jgi:Mn2+/Fe2+ NRAMP family transporter
MIALIILMLLAFCITLVVVRPGPGILSGLVPSVPTGSSKLIIAFTASCFSLVAAFYQAYLVHERKKNAPATSVPSRSGSRPGIVLLGILILTVMLCAAAALHTRGIEVHTAQDMAMALEPLFGSYAAYLFLIGLFGASFSSLIGNATVGGTLLGDALSGQSRLDSGLVRSLIAVIMIAGAVIAVIFGKVPLEAIVIAQSITIFIVPVIGLSLLALGNDKQLMGHAVNTPPQKTGGIIGLCVLLLLAAINVRDLFF